MREAYLYKKIDNRKVQCLNCAHYCMLSDNQKGICGVRKNIGGKLYSLVYGKAAAVNIDPIEKKPFFHFLPRTYSLSIATVGCNLRCLYCQNWDISQNSKSNNQIFCAQEICPEGIVQMAIKNKTPSISYTYTEPTVFLEYALDAMKIAKEKGFKNAWVTNGFMSREVLEIITPYLDAANVDLKGFSEDFYQKVCGAKLKPVLGNLKEIKKRGIWVEVTTLVIPTLNDDEKTFRGIAKFIKEELGPETPWHISQFCGAISWQLKNLPDTPIETLERAYEIGKETGLKYVYTGNVPGHKGEDTICPKCGVLAIDRMNYFIRRYDKNGKCPRCGEDLNIITE